MRICPVVAAVVAESSADAKQLVAVVGRQRVPRLGAAEAQEGKPQFGASAIRQIGPYPGTELLERLAKTVEPVGPLGVPEVELDREVVAGYPGIDDFEQERVFAAEQRPSPDEEVAPQHVHRLERRPERPAVLVGHVV